MLNSIYIHRFIFNFYEKMWWNRLILSTRCTIMEKSINISRSIMLYIVQLLAVQYIANCQEQSTNLYLFIYIRFTSSFCCIFYIIKVLALNTTEGSYILRILQCCCCCWWDRPTITSQITANTKHREYTTLWYIKTSTPLTMKRSYIYISRLFLLSILLYLGQIKTGDLSCLCTTSKEKFYSMMGYTSVIPIILYNCSVWASAIGKKRVVASLKAAQRILLH